MLINCVAYENGSRLADLAVEEISDYLARPDCFVWFAAAFAGIWGMNFKSMPELQWEYGYPMALFAISAACVGLYAHFRRVGWL